MKDDSSVATEVRVKLHITSSEDSHVKNLWMCLNYDQKPSVQHVMEHIRKNFCQTPAAASSKKATSQKYAVECINDEPEMEVKLFLEDFWLPPYENSRLIRENDCIKVEIKSVSEPCSDAVKIANLAKGLKLKVDLGHKSGELDDNQSNAKAYPHKYLHDQAKANEDYFGDEAENEEYYSQYYEANYDPISYWSNTLLPPKATSGKKTGGDWQKMIDRTRKVGPQQPQESQKDVTVGKSSNSNQSNKPTGPKSSEGAKNVAKTNNKETVGCYKKFAIGNYVHMLNEQAMDSQAPSKKKEAKQYVEEDEDDDNNLSEEQIIDDYFESLQKKTLAALKTNKQGKSAKPQQAAKPKSNVQPAASGEATADWDKIAANVNSTGKQKWKNSTKPTNSNGPKHIIFSTTSASSSDTTSSDSDDEEATTSKTNTKQSKPSNNVQKNVKQADKVPPAASNASVGNKKNKKSENTKTSKACEPNNQKKNPFYEPSKEEQVNSVSYNREFLVQNTKSLVDFKKIFNEAKLNAPQAEEFADKMDESATTLHKKESNKVEDQLDTSTCSMESGSSSASGSSNGGGEGENGQQKKEKKNGRRNGRRSPSPKFDYERLESLVGAPRLNDKLAFKILEISSNFTPEISNYKSGTVVDFDAQANEVTLKLDGKYNAVLERPNKFTVVIDENEEDKESLAKMEQNENESKKNGEADDNLLRVDWRNLMNVKIIPKTEASQPTEQAKPVEQQQQQILI